MVSQRQPLHKEAAYKNGENNFQKKKRYLGETSYIIFACVEADETTHHFINMPFYDGNVERQFSFEMGKKEQGWRINSDKVEIKSHEGHELNGSTIDGSRKSHVSKPPKHTGLPFVIV